MTTPAAQSRISYEIIKGVALTLGVFGVSVSLPLLGFFLSIFLPLPILFYRLKLGRRSGAYIPLIAFGVMTLLLGRLTFDSLFFAELMLIGFIMGECLEAGYRIEKTALYACAAVIAVGWGLLFLYAESQNAGMVETISQHLHQNLALTIKLYEEIGILPQEEIQHLKGVIERVHFILLRLLPSLVVSFWLMVIWISYLLIRKVALLRDLALPDSGPLKFWRAPEHLVWIVIGCGLAMLIPDVSVKLMGANGLIVLMTIYFFSGIAIVAYFFEKYRFPRPLRIFSYILIMFHQLTLIVVIGIGFFDIWLNFRKSEASGNKDI